MCESRNDSVLDHFHAEIENTLIEYFATLPEYDLYKQQAYFMGLRNESFAPRDNPAGKRMRPVLCLLLADAYGCKQKALPLALSLELFHNFTLIHDDIVDGDEFRRGRPTVWKQFGVNHAINSGDVQLIMALEVLVQNGPINPLLWQFLLQQYRMVGEGQFLDFELTNRPLTDQLVTVECYFEMISRKTAELLVATTKGAGLVSGVSETELEQLAVFGLNIGIAYQLQDDLLSVWGNTEQTGKSLHGDIKERKKTFPVIFTYQEASSSVRSELEYWFSGDELADKEARLSHIITLLNISSAKAETIRHIQKHQLVAREAVQVLQVPEDTKRVLHTLVDMVGWSV